MLKSPNAIAVRVPLRISFAGGGTDVEPYPSKFGGAVLSTTISSYVHIDLWESECDEVSVNSIDLGFESKWSRFDEEGKFKSSLFGSCLAEFDRSSLSNIKMNVRSPVPPGSGLGTSSAITLGMLAALNWALEETKWNKTQLAERAYFVERERLGIPGGIQDQYACSFGGFNFLEIHSARDVSVLELSPNKDFLLELEHNLMLFKLPGSRMSDGIISEQVTRLKESSGLELYHEQKRIAFQMKDAIMESDLRTVGNLLHHAWECKKSYSRKITSEFIDLAYATAIGAGALGGKLLGAGGGGYLLFLARRNSRHFVVEAMNNLNLVEHPVVFSHEGLQIWRAST